MSLKERYWLKQIRYNIVPTFPRGMHIPRSEVHDVNGYVILAKFSKNKPDYTTVYSNWEQQNKIASAIFLDIDGSDMVDSLKFITSNWEVLDRLGAGIISTGGHGYHIYIPIKPVKIDLKESTDFITDLLKGGKDYIDKQTVGDWNRLGRLPFTINNKSGKLSKPIKDMQYTALTEQLSKILAEVHGISKYSFTTTIKPPKEIVSYGIPPPCIMYLLDLLRTSHYLNHPQRIHLVSFLKDILKRDELISLFRLAEDFNEQITSYHVDYIKERNLKPYGCDKAKTNGICPFPLQQEICPYYPSIARSW